MRSALKFLFLALAVAPWVTVQPVSSEQGLDGPGHAINPNDPIYWVTLTDEISPQELERRRTDPVEIRRRFRGSHQGRKYPDRERGLVEFVDPGRNPELIAMHEAFYFFAVHFTDVGFTSDEEREYLVMDLRDAGFTEDGVTKFVASLWEYRERSERLNLSLAPIYHKIQDAIDILRSELPFPQVEDAIGRAQSLARKGNIKAAAAILKISEEDALEFAELLSRDLGKEVVGPILKALAADLAHDGDWDRLRSYLKEYVAESLGAFQEWEEQ